MKPKKQTLIIISAIILTISSYSRGSFGKNDDGKQIVANYKNGVVTLGQVEGELSKLSATNPKLKGLSFDNLSHEEKEMVVKEVVLKEMIYKQAKKQKLNKSEDYKEAIRLFEMELLKQKLFLKLAEEAKQEENLKDHYDKLVLELKEKEDYRISYIALNKEVEAKSVYKRLAKNPSLFAKEAKQKSIDKETALKGGDLGFVLEDVLPLEIIAQAKKLTKSEISKPFKLNDKWVVIKLTDKRQAEVASFVDAKEALSVNLARKAIQDFIGSSIKESEISILIR